ARNGAVDAQDIMECGITPGAARQIGPAEAGCQAALGTNERAADGRSARRLDEDGDWRAFDCAPEPTDSLSAAEADDHLLAALAQRRTDRSRAHFQGAIRLCQRARFLLPLSRIIR